MQTRYKLTTPEMQTHMGCEWTIGEWKEAPGKGLLCSSGWIHCYDSTLLAVLMNPIHANFRSPRLFECESDGLELDDSGLKRGVQRLRLIRELQIPKPSRNQRLRFGILCALKINASNAFERWAQDWLSGKDRTIEAACDVSRKMGNILWATTKAQWDAAIAVTSTERYESVVALAAWATANVWKMAKQEKSTDLLVKRAKEWPDLDFASWATEAMVEEF